MAPEINSSIISFASDTAMKYDTYIIRPRNSWRNQFVSSDLLYRG